MSNLNFTNGPVKAYLADFDFGEAHLAEIEIGGETPLYYLRCKITNERPVENLKMMFCISKRLAKSDHRVFATLKEALGWLYKKALDSFNKADKEKRLVERALESIK